jgi:hypothetical protein
MAKRSAIKDVTIDVHANQVLALIGPSGCGKSTFLRSLNRMNDTVPGRVGHRPRRARWRGHLRAGGRSRARSAARRHGLPAVEPVPEVDLRERGLRASHRGHFRTACPGRARRARAAPRGSLGRGQGPSRRVRAGPFRRAAAAPLHRSSARRGARGAADGRAGQRARPDRDGEDRGPGGRASRRADDRHRHPQHAAGGSRLAADGLFLHGPARRSRGHDADLHTPQERETEDYITGRFG